MADDLTVRLLAIAADPTWSPVLRTEAKVAAHDHDLDPGHDSDEAIADALRARIVRRRDTPEQQDDPDWWREALARRFPVAGREEVP